MTQKTSRRKYVQLMGISVAIGLAGCLGNDDETEEKVDTDNDRGDAADGENGTGDTVGNDDDAGDDIGGDSETQEPEDTDGGQEGDDDGVANTRLRDVFNWEMSYVMEYESSEGAGSWTLHHDDSYMRWEGTDGLLESYHITTDSGVETYSIIDGQCMKMSAGMPADDVFDPEEPADSGTEHYAIGTTTIDGIEAYIFEVEDGLYYISVSTGYPLRFEDSTGDLIVTFHSWGATNPISPPDTECIEF